MDNLLLEVLYFDYLEFESDVTGYWPIWPARNDDIILTLKIIALKIRGVKKFFVLPKKKKRKFSLPYVFLLRVQN